MVNFNLAEEVKFNQLYACYACLTSCHYLECKVSRI